jgi:adenylyltransferase/sulfurtransferase
LPTCSTVGVHPSVLSVIGSIEVAEAINLILGTPRLAGKLLYFSLRDLTIDHVEISKSNNCPVCSEGLKPLKLESKLLVEEVCGRKGLPTFVISPPSIMNIDMSNVKRRLRRVGAKIIVNGKYGVTFNFKGFNVSLLKSGVTVIEGIDSNEKAEELYEEITKILL